MTMQLFLRFVEIERRQFAQHLMEILSFIHKEYQVIEPDESEGERKFCDQYIYPLLNVLTYVIKHCSSGTQLLA